MEYLTVPQLVNIELTTYCPLQCKQCFAFNTRKHMPLTLAQKIIKEIASLGVEYINISGGDPLQHPQLNIIIKEASNHKVKTNIAVSGVGITDKTLDALLSAGLHGIFISLNGSTEEINMLSRDGYSIAMQALTNKNLLNFKIRGINWVMQHSNTLDFPNIVKLAENLNLTHITILSKKPSLSGTLEDYPIEDDLYFMVHFIKQYHGPIQLDVDLCFSQLLALLGKGLFINTNTGMFKGCTAGIDSIAINVHGEYQPCRHLMIPEQWLSISDYWNHSKILHQLRHHFDMETHTCHNCTLKYYCRPCAAISNTQKLDLSMNNTYCPLSQVNNQEE